MKANRYDFLLFSFTFFTICCYVLYLKYVKAKEFAIQDGGIQAGCYALNLEIILTAIPPIIIVIHIVAFIICKIKDKGWRRAATPVGRSMQADTLQKRSYEEDWRMPHGKRPPAA